MSNAVPHLESSPLPPLPEGGALDALADEALDALTLGVLCLDAEGRIVRCNLTEARFCRLDRTGLLGRHYFREVAPPRAAGLLEAHFRRFLAGGPAHHAFEATLDFRFGQQEVRVELVRASARRVYLVLHRQALLPPEPRLPPEACAPLQAGLSPGEASQGVQRDAVGRRGVVVHPAFLHSLHATLDRVAPRAAPLLAAEWGFRWGRQAAVELEVESLERHARPLRNLPMRAVAELMSAALQEQGWGLLSVDWSTWRRGAFVARLERSALAEAAGPGPTPRCQLVAGYLRGVVCHLAQKPLLAREVGCRAQGHPHCSFVVVGAHRKAALERALAGCGGDVARLLVLLETAGSA